MNTEQKHKLVKQLSIIGCFVACFDLDKEETYNRIVQMIEKGEEAIKFKEWTKYPTEDLGSLERKYWAKGGSVMRRMSLKSFLKEYKTGSYLLMLDTQMVYVRNGMIAFGKDASLRSGINKAIKIIK